MDGDKYSQLKLHHLVARGQRWIRGASEAHRRVVEDDLKIPLPLAKGLGLGLVEQPAEEQLLADPADLIDWHLSEEQGGSGETCASLTSSRADPAGSSGEAHGVAHGPGEPQPSSSGAGGAGGSDDCYDDDDDDYAGDDEDEDEDESGSLDSGREGEGSEEPAHRGTPAAGSTRKSGRGGARRVRDAGGEAGAGQDSDLRGDDDHRRPWIAWCQRKKVSSSLSQLQCALVKLMFAHGPRVSYKTAVGEGVDLGCKSTAFYYGKDALIERLGAYIEHRRQQAEQTRG